MEALYHFTQVDPHRNVFDLETTVESTSSPDWKKVFKLKYNNYVNLHKEKVRLLINGYFIYIFAYILYIYEYL